MINVLLLGALGERFGREWNLEISTPSEAIRAIACQRPGFDSYLNNADCYQITIDDAIAVDGESLDYRIKERLVIAPIVAGSGAVGRIFTGAALLGASFFMPAAFLGISSVTIGQFGASMVAGGIVQLLSPQESGNGQSFQANALEEAVQGQPIPVLFGTRFIKPPVISSWVENENINVDFVP